MPNRNIYRYDEMKRREHMAVRETVGWYLFIHHLVEVTGPDATAFLDKLCPKGIDADFENAGGRIFGIPFSIVPPCNNKTIAMQNIHLYNLIIRANRAKTSTIIILSQDNIHFFEL